MTLAVFMWVACAGLTTIPASRHGRTERLSERYSARHLAIGLLLFWPAVLTWIARDRAARIVRNLAANDGP